MFGSRVVRLFWVNSAILKIQPPKIKFIMKNVAFLITITNCERNFEIELIVSVMLNIFTQKVINLVSKHSKVIPDNL